MAVLIQRQQGIFDPEEHNIKNIQKKKFPEESWHLQIVAKSWLINQEQFKNNW